MVAAVNIKATPLLDGTAVTLAKDSKSCSEDNSLESRPAHVSRAVPKAMHDAVTLESAGVQSLVADSPCSSLHAAAATQADNSPKHMTIPPAIQHVAGEEEDHACSNDNHLTPVPEADAVEQSVITISALSGGAGSQSVPQPTMDSTGVPDSADDQLVDSLWHKPSTADVPVKGMLRAPHGVGSDAPTAQPDK